MSAEAVGHIWNLDLPANKRLVLLAYADHADHEGNNMWPSVGLIAWKTGYSERQVKRITKQLIQQDGILIEEGRGPKGVNRYRLDWEAGTKKPPRGGDNLSPKEEISKDSEALFGSVPAGGDNLSPKEGGLQKQHVPSIGGDILSTGGDKLSNRGDIAVSPKPSLTQKQEPQEGDSSDNQESLPPAAGVIDCPADPDPEKQRRVRMLTDVGVHPSVAAGYSSLPPLVLQAAIAAARERQQAGGIRTSFAAYLVGILDQALLDHLPPAPPRASPEDFYSEAEVEMGESEEIVF